MSDTNNEERIQNVLALFDEINTVPRRTHHLEKIHPWLMDWGKSHGFRTKTDAAKNIVLEVPSKGGSSSAPTIVLQGHMDMVCEKRPGVSHDFSKDPIRSWRDGDWLRARDTSLGADNGIALALFFDLVTDPDAVYPNLEILITTDEESGLVGAQKISPDILSGSVLLNLDSEDEGVFTIGCAGGEDVSLNFPVDRDSGSEWGSVRKITVTGLEGGHSGIEINSGKASANVLLVRVLRMLLDKIPELRLGDIRGGSAHNAIAREASTIIAVPAGKLDVLGDNIKTCQQIMGNEYSVTEKNLEIKVEEAEAPSCGFLGTESALKVVDTLRQLPHGVWAMSNSIQGAVNTSANFAVLKTEEKNVKALINRRSATASQGEDLSDRLTSLTRLYGGSFKKGFQYPSWEPRYDSEVLVRCKKIWKELSGKDADIEVTHAGLECGAIGAKYPNMDMISLGPTIRQPHSPNERMYIPSVGKIRSFLGNLLASYTRAQ